MDALAAIEASAAELEAAASTPAESQTADTNTTTSTTTATDSHASADTTDQQGQTTQTTDTAAKPKGPIPFDRHEAVLKNTRDEYDARIAKLSWAESLDPEVTRGRLAALELADQDPLEFYNRLGQQLRQDSRFASHFTPKTEAAPEKEDPRPQPDVLLDDGTVTYSSKQLDALFEWKDRQTERRFETRFGPIEQKHQGEKAWNSALSRQARVLADARTWEGFNENQKEIASLMASDGRVSLESAYRRVVIPKLKAQEADLRKKVRDELIVELNAKRDGSTAAPSGPATSRPASTDGMTIEDILRQTNDELMAAER